MARRHFRAIAAAAAEGHVTRAAERLGMHIEFQTKLDANFRT